MCATTLVTAGGAGGAGYIAIMWVDAST
jgi:hypothetical protein